MNKVTTTMTSRGELILRMQENDLLKGLSNDIYRFLADLSEVWSYENDEVIVEINEPSTAFYILVEGQAAVVLEGGVHIADLGPSDGFGEIGLLLGTSRTATVCAKTSVKVICVGREQFFQCFDRFPNMSQSRGDLVTEEA